MRYIRTRARARGPRGRVCAAEAATPGAGLLANPSASFGGAACGAWAVAKEPTLQVQPSGGLRLAPPVASASSRPTPQNSCILSLLAGLAAAALEACCGAAERPDAFQFKARVLLKTRLAFPNIIGGEARGVRDAVSTRREPPDNSPLVRSQSHCRTARRGGLKAQTRCSRSPPRARPPRGAGGTKG